MKDIRDDIFRGIAKKKVTAVILADDNGILAEIGAVCQAAEEIGLEILNLAGEGDVLNQRDQIIRFCGSPKQMALAEERLIGLMAKASGIATAARRFVDEAGPRLEIVSGAWKKMHVSQKEIIRRAIRIGGARCRISQEPFLYLDKNYVKMLGGVGETLDAVSDFNGYLRVVQIIGAHNDIALEAGKAVEHGAGVVFIDSGLHDDLRRVGDGLREVGLRHKVKIAFGGGIRLEDIKALKALDVDVLDIGRQIVDAPLLDMHMEVIEEQ